MNSSHKLCFYKEIAGYEIMLSQHKTNKSFQVVYGEEVKNGLTYSEAASQLGSSIMHALACESKLDNSGK